MNSTFYSLSPRGLEADLITIEVDHYASNPGTVIVGLGDTAVHESRERVRAALKNNNFFYPRGRVVVNLAPADIRKSGPVFDLPIALGMIAVSDPLLQKSFDDTIFVGELSLDGELRPVQGVLGLLRSAQQMGFQKAFIPQANAEEARFISDIEILPAPDLRTIYEVLVGELPEIPLKKPRRTETLFKENSAQVDLSDIKGQSFAKRALEIAAAGSHNILLNGAPGSGKTMMARALQGILPKLQLEEALEISQIYSVAGMLPESPGMITERPFRVVHHTATGSALVGGGSVPRPGEISLAHRGVLFLDEVAEFPTSTLELLRQPLEDREITISRANGSFTYPSQFVLCAAMNPCPCGYANSEQLQKHCTCTAAEQRRYAKKLSGPLLDRIDLHCPVAPVDHQKLHADQETETTAHVRKRVQKARSFQQKRLRSHGIRTNAEMGTAQVKTLCPLTNDQKTLLDGAASRLNLSARAYIRTIKVARTIADLEESANVETPHLLEALQYRAHA